MSDDQPFWESIIDGHDRATAPPDGEPTRTVEHGTGARLLDAAIVVVRAMRDLASVAEEVLVEQRKRIERPRQPARPRNAGDGSGRSEERIDLTY